MSEPTLLIPALGDLYTALAPWVEALLRVVIGLALVPHGLRMAFGFFPDTGLPIRNLGMLSEAIERTGWRPGWLWGPVIAVTQLIGGPLLALGLFTRVAAVPIVIFLLAANVERWRVGRYFWNTLGMEYTLMWSVGALYFLINGGGTISLDALIGWEF